MGLFHVPGAADDQGCGWGKAIKSVDAQTRNAKLRDLRLELGRNKWGINASTRKVPIAAE